MKVNFPVFIRAKDCGEILKFKSVYDMQYKLESVDIQNDEYEAWDKNGLPLKLGVQRPVWLHIEPRSSEMNPEQLKQAIIDFAALSGISLNIANTSFDCETIFDHVITEIKKKKTSGGLWQRFIRKIMGSGC